MSSLFKYFFVLAALIGCQSAYADEGMWMVHAIDSALEKKMRERGLELSAGEIYNADAPGATVADAVVSMAFGCTGSIISDNGLLITNHHCAYSDIHALSTPEHNYLEEGFWAMRSEEERNIPMKSVYFLKRVLDVTEETLELKAELEAAGMPSGTRRLSSVMEKKYAEGTGLEALLSSMWDGSKYYMALYEVYRDVRLVAAPPVSSAAFGGDVDNWEWPQHKCDFAMYRVYTAPDGSPAFYSEDNVPLKPKAKLAISLDGYQDGDYTMILGYPGSTNRYSSSFETNFNETVRHPICNELRGRQMEIIKGWMDADPSVRLKYADYYFSLSNVQELYSGEAECLDRFNVVEEKEAVERELMEWIRASPERIERWGSLLDDLRAKYLAVEDGERNINYYRETVVRGTRIARVCYRKNAKAIMREFEGIDLRVERNLFGYAVEKFYEEVDPRFWGDYHREMIDRYGSAEAVAEAVWEGSSLTDEGRLAEFLSVEEHGEGHGRRLGRGHGEVSGGGRGEGRGEGRGRGYRGGEIDLSGDSLYRFFQDTKITVYNDAIASAEGEPRRLDLNREYTHALYQMRLDKGIAQYPDANSTMRITYGTVGGYSPYDGVLCDWKTTPAGILEKYNPADYDFSLNGRQLSLYLEGDWGRWGFGPEGRGMYVNFLTDNDITGGNSGSPVLNSRGELIGLAFDGNKESLSSDLWYAPGYNKCVCVDIRFILWTLDRYAGMTRIIEELGL